uniref:Uncharacterized protein n=1 Tax=Setaria viridis TaxID=4556 RepID=A0A4U6VAX2_SETVI|nr:hypothetical protein SEVIR_3G195100v2 [Setaria viridis]
MGNCACQAASRRDAEAEPWSGSGEPATERVERGESGEGRAGVKVTVAVRISKRRLQMLMAEAAGGGAGGMTVEEVLAEIVSAGEVVVGGRHRRRWEPALQSIPEAVES